jgi:two-component system, OmpR family, aerobic respiration control sensor histidine kinase ArcB
VINTSELSLLKIHEALSEFSKNQPPQPSKFQDAISYYSDVILCMPGNVYWMDRDCLTVGCNQNVLDMFGLASMSEFIGLSFADLARMGQWDKNQAQSFEKDTLEVITTGETKANIEEPPICGADGKEVYFITTRVPLFNRDNEVIGIVGISTDITYRKEIENSLVLAKEKAEVANKAKKQFLYNMRHDIRTPFTGIISVAEMLKHLETDQRKLTYINAIHSSAECLLNYLNEILELTKIEDGSLPIVCDDMNLEELARSCFAMLLPVFQDKAQLTFVCNYSDDLPKYVVSDEFRIKRILINLLSNAVKFTDQGCVTLDINFSSIEGSLDKHMVTLVVSDTGIGIPKEKQERIFEKFERLTPSYAGKYKGSGLGLFMVKSLVTELGGDIRVLSESGQGTSFFCNIPMSFSSNQSARLVKNDETSEQSKQVSAGESSSENALSPVRILLAEDESVAQMVLVDLFSRLGCKLDLARTGEEAVSLFEERGYDLVLLDIGLPGCSGFEVSKKIRTLAEGVATPIFALTAHAKDDVEENCIFAGMNGVLSKPLSEKAATSLLKKYFSGKVAIEK